MLLPQGSTSSINQPQRKGAGVGELRLQRCFIALMTEHHLENVAQGRMEFEQSSLELKEWDGQKSSAQSCWGLGPGGV